MISPKAYQQNVTKVCFHSFMTGLRPFLPILFVFLKGLDYSYLQIGTLFSILSFTGLVLEVPAGSFADKYGAKLSMMLATFLLGTSFLLIGIVENYNIMIMIFMIWGMGNSFYSGSDTTLIIESLKMSNRLEKTSKYLSKKWASFYYGLAGGGLLCPLFLLYFEQRFAFFFTAILCYLSILLLMSVKQPPIEKNRDSEIHHVKTPLEYLKFLNRGKNYLFRHKDVKQIIIFTVIFSTSSLIFFQYIQVMLSKAGIPKTHFGLYYAIFTFVAALSSQQAHFLDDKLGEKRVIYILIILTLMSLLSVKLLFIFPLVVIPIFIMQLQAGIYIPVMAHYLNKHIESHHRTTLNSMKTFMSRLTMAVLSPAVGFIADKYDFRTALFYLGFFVLTVAIFPALKVSRTISRVSSTEQSAET